MSAAPASFFHTEIPMLTHLDCDEMSDRDDPGTHPLSNYIALRANYAEHVQPPDGLPEWGAISAQLWCNLPPPVADNGEDDRLANITAMYRSSQDLLVDSSENNSPETAYLIQSPGARFSQSEASVTGQTRKQNHSCDRCRISKRACDLPQNVEIRNQKPIISCTTCNGRGIVCTVAWLSNKKALQHTRKRPRTMSCIEETDITVVDSITAPAALTQELTATQLVDCQASTLAKEGELSRKLVSRDACIQHFNLYVDVIDMPLAHCIAHASMPSRYPLGLAALGPLGNSSHMSAYFDQVNKWVDGCWEAQTSSWAFSSGGPHVFRAASVLDCLFQHNGTQTGRAPVSRDALITETYRWVTIATAAQFKIPNNRRSSPAQPEQWDPKTHPRDIALETWRRAKKLLFKNIAVAHSFRLALCLLLFGMISVPTTGENTAIDREDALYAFCEGVRRLKTLSTEARACVLASSGGDKSFPNPRSKPPVVQGLPPDIQENVLELIAAIEWLSTMANCIVVASSRGKVCPIPLNMYSSTFGSPCSAYDMTQSPESDIFSVVLPHDCRTDHLIVSRTDEGRNTFVDLACGESTEDMLLQAVRRSGSVAVHLWISLASLTMDVENLLNGKADYEALHRRFITAVRLVKLWRLSFGKLENRTASCIKKLASETRRLAGFCLNDGDLAILVFCAIARRLETGLAGDPSSQEKDSLASVLQSSKSYRQKQRLISAQQVSTFAAVSQGSKSLGFQGNGGLKANIQDIAAHPYPIMVVQAQTLAAKAFADEVHEMINILDLKGAAEMSAGLETCLGALGGLQETLVTLPDLHHFHVKESV
ncbi:hypothetical protein BDV39DRAFT_204338 [Aspergillus sergii]|uniref:Zn(2)-C6 fungal-type domain-containing protein n=1 Tax=Aspergillus sergii TaxID=1034303 RepID=A0A5N6X3X5_9EURO|nr:hypothetical protein BDV39DRAFT_204338 [Aspergillus sergii]